MGLAASDVCPRDILSRREGQRKIVLQSKWSYN